MPSRRLAQVAVGISRGMGHTGSAGWSSSTRCFRRHMHVAPTLSISNESNVGCSSRSPSRGKGVDGDFFTPYAQTTRVGAWSPRRWRGGSIALLAALPIETTAPLASGSGSGSGPEVEPTYTALTSYPPFTTIGEMILSSPLPSYGLTIVLSTILLRGLITLPVTIWQRRRQERLATIVGPLVQKKSNEIAKELLAEHVKEGRRRTAENERVFTKELERRVSRCVFELGSVGGRF
jgi:hypothetical protein